MTELKYQRPISDHLDDHRWLSMFFERESAFWIKGYHQSLDFSCWSTPQRWLLVNMDQGLWMPDHISQKKFGKVKHGDLFFAMKSELKVLVDNNSVHQCHFQWNLFLQSNNLISYHYCFCLASGADALTLGPFVSDFQNDWGSCCLSDWFILN